MGNIAGRPVRILWLGLLLTGYLMAPALSAPIGKKEHNPAIPLPWLTAEEQSRFETGRALFEFPFTPRDGLGPVFNGRNCEACHHTPSIGGHGPGYRANTRYILPSTASTQGLLFHDKSIAKGPAELLPENAILSKRRPGTLMGLGLIEAIPEEALLVHADPDDTNRDGIRGRAAVQGGRLMRFGSQAHVGSLFEFVADALRQELGLTSPVPGFTTETADVNVPIRTRNRIPQPNVSLDVVNNLVDFISMLAPPERNPTMGTDRQVIRGEQLFKQIDCAVCHVPTYRTATRPTNRQAQQAPMPDALLNREIHPYSDFLLHDMGSTLNDGISLGVAKPAEFRTPPLWGLRFRLNQLLHDSRGSNPEQAIIFHGGEAARSRNAFLALPAEDRRALMEFLKSL
ncbi:MAG: di-heme oxidoredictase family protein [Nitrospirota bacterium]